MRVDDDDKVTRAYAKKYALVQANQRLAGGIDLINWGLNMRSPQDRA
ncbi:hypothetical protein G3N59_21750 [Paraburkholderia sp. Ac-20340]|nr:hypothetical protein [Paraburkholderia sp. Ac-20340]MBN3856008.1 hypothetical protein [Paraburkholderia sp. Ac-20340]